MDCNSRQDLVLVSVDPGAGSCGVQGGTGLDCELAFLSFFYCVRTLRLHLPRVDWVYSCASEPFRIVNGTQLCALLGHLCDTGDEIGGSIDDPAPKSEQ
jgi:hypothetical protein